jgi:predicted RNase H-like HicB family nuclease
MEEASQMQYTVLLKQTDGKFIARVPALPECVAEGPTRDRAIENVRAAIARLLEEAEVMTVEVDGPLVRRDEDPWMKVRGMFRDDPDYEEVLKEIAAYRKQVDEEWQVK